MALFPSPFAMACSASPKAESSPRSVRSPVRLRRESDAGGVPRSSRAGSGDFSEISAEEYGSTVSLTPRGGASVMCTTPCSSSQVYVPAETAAATARHDTRQKRASWNPFIAATLRKSRPKALTFAQPIQIQRNPPHLKFRPEPTVGWPPGPDGHPTQPGKRGSPRRSKKMAASAAIFQSHCTLNLLVAAVAERLVPRSPAGAPPVVAGL